MNKSLKTVVIAPITSTYKPYPTRIAISQNKTTGWIAVDQIRSRDKQRIVGIVGQMSESDIELVKAVMKETYVD